MLKMQTRLSFGPDWDPNGVLKPTTLCPVLKTPLGCLFEGDCGEILPSIADESIDTVFADPPFNIGKVYGAKVNDARPNDEYVDWCRKWIDECIRVLKPGGAFFLYNLPRWNILLGAHLTQRGLS